MKYKTKQVEIEAIQYTGKNGTEILRFMFPDIEDDAVAFDETIKTLEGEMHCSVGDYIIKGLKGEFYPCKPDIFNMKYEEIIKTNEWRENKKASGGRHYVNRKLNKEIFIDSFGEARIMEIDSGKWDKSIKVKKDDSLEKIIKELLK